jgi:hypothetical protein
MIRSVQTMHLSCVKISTISKRTERAPLDTHHLGLPSGASKTIYDPMVRLRQTEHLSCTDANTVSKQIEMRFHMTHTIKEFHRVPPILFLSLWYVWRKPTTCLAPMLTPSWNRSKWDSARSTSPRSSIGCLQYYSEPTANRGPMLHQE